MFNLPSFSLRFSHTLALIPLVNIAHSNIQVG